VTVGVLTIRADADTAMGAGHVMRCLALSQAWMAEGDAVVFVSADLPESLAVRLEAEGVSVVDVVGKRGSTDDAAQAASYAGEDGGLWLVVDGYHFDNTYREKLKASDLNVLAIDDGYLTEHVHADVVLNQNLGAESLRYAAKRVLLGTDYVLLRSEFRDPTLRKGSVRNAAGRVLVTLGGGDPDNQTMKVVDALKEIDRPGLHSRVLMGQTNPHLNTLRKATSDFSGIEVMSHVTDMPSLIAWADIAISAGGSTCWELAFAGVPNLVLVIADNQRPIAAALDQAGASVSMGWFESVQVGDIASALCAVMDSETLRESMRKSGQDLVDGAGAGRVAEVLRRAV
jgi:UDP-2,4-diacetamido-2,4,6-trideoxy-beta-L-altropyranose hydrolase